MIFSLTSVNVVPDRNIAGFMASKVRVATSLALIPDGFPPAAGAGIGAIGCLFFSSIAVDCVSFEPFVEATARLMTLTMKGDFFVQSSRPLTGPSPPYISCFFSPVLSDEFARALFAG
jgi:hypothetical protein